MGNISSTSIGDKVEQGKEESHHEPIKLSNDEVNNSSKEDQSSCEEGIDIGNIFSNETQLPSPSQKFFYFYQGNYDNIAIFREYKFANEIDRNERLCIIMIYRKKMYVYVSPSSRGRTKRLSPCNERKDVGNAIWQS